MYLVHYCEVTRMGAYADVYLNDVVEVQGKLFDFFAQKFPDKDTEDFIETYMRSKTRKSIDESQAYVMTMDVQTLWEYFLKMINIMQNRERGCRDFRRTGWENFMRIINGITMYRARK